MIFKYENDTYLIHVSSKDDDNDIYINTHCYINDTKRNTLIYLPSKRALEMARSIIKELEDKDDI
jgi:hypothetical protein